MSEFFFTFIIAAAITAGVTPLAIKVAPLIGAMDVPKDNRRMHGKPIPRLGGIAIYVGIIVSFFRLMPWNQQIFGIVLGGTLMLCIGVYDDLKNMNPKLKLLAQIVCALIVFYFSVQLRVIANFLPFGPKYFIFPIWLSLILTVFWIVGITNTINLIDGLDGLAAGIVCIACISVAYTAAMNGRLETTYIMLSVAGSTLGFLIFNFYPAKIFMGDGGSMLLGFLLASLSLVGDTPTKGTTLFATVVPIMILALPIFDTAFAIFRRMLNKKPIMQADKGHLHHRIMAMGFGQRRTVLALYSISAIMGVSGILWSSGMKVEALALGLVAATLIFIFLGIGIVELDPECRKDFEEIEDSQEETNR
ncbi:MAG: undecaprenyl/decaprenyl-phosphate alpha-N-acetylglucosaminyl 1-phosphate transferase [Clostridia bacterium]|nr:undecaprenyl/decaprenyl-phosphate alpha-N-acetylglucosaminyl 1-phosphate transferase [Clostridia bacterium]